MFAPADAPAEPCSNFKSAPSFSSPSILTAPGVKPVRGKTSFTIGCCRLISPSPVKRRFTSTRSGIKPLAGATPISSGITKKTVRALPGLHYRLVFSRDWDRIRKNFIRVVDGARGALHNAICRELLPSTISSREKRGTLLVSIVSAGPLKSTQSAAPPHKFAGIRLVRDVELLLNIFRHPKAKVFGPATDQSLASLAQLRYCDKRHYGGRSGGVGGRRLNAKLRDRFLCSPLRCISSHLHRRPTSAPTRTASKRQRHAIQGFAKRAGFGISFDEFL